MAYDLIKISGLPLVTPDSGQDIVVGVGDYAKRINYNAVKADMVGTSPSYTTDTEPYLMRQTAHVVVVGKCALEKLVGGSLGWNQIANPVARTASGVTITVSNGVITFNGTSTAVVYFNLNTAFRTATNHVYYIKKNQSQVVEGVTIYNVSNGIDVLAPIDEAIQKSTGEGILYVRINSGVTLNNITMKPQVFDLTQTFGSTIADYMLSLGSANGIAWLSKYINLGTYHAYDAGSIQSVQATEHVTTGFNQFDEVVEAGYWDVSTGQKASGGSWMRCANYIPVLPNTEYKIHFTSGSGSQGSLIYLDGNKSVISYISSYISAVITTPSNCRYMVFYANSGWFGGNICINISKTTGTPKNGDYVPYSGHSYPLGSDTLRGYPMLINNKLAFDGDEKLPDGTTRRRYNIVDLGSLNWTYDSTAATPIFSTSLNSLPATCKSNSANMICPKYLGAYQFWSVAGNDKKIGSGGSNLNVSDSAFTDAATFKAAVSGIYLVYPLAEEVTESSTAYQKIQTVDADGTESFTTSSPVPVGHETQTPDNVLAALEWLGE